MPPSNGLCSILLILLCACLSRISASHQFTDSQELEVLVTAKSPLDLFLCIGRNRSHCSVAKSAFSIRERVSRHKIPLSIPLPVRFRDWSVFVRVVNKGGNSGFEESFFTLPPLNLKEWTTLEVGTTQLQYRYSCKKGFYGAHCGIPCSNRDDANGHWECASDGSKKCLPGWSGSNCLDRVCKLGCENGLCKNGTCQCNNGWMGERCDQCKPSPNCVHGTCDNGNVYTCKCQDGWEGPNCDQRSICLIGHQCPSHSKCVSTRPNEYECICDPGYKGRFCMERVAKEENVGFPLPANRTEDECGGCLNGGQCRRIRERSNCQCQPGFEGDRCEISLPTATHSSLHDLSFFSLFLLNALCVLVLLAAVFLLYILIRLFRDPSTQNAVNQRLEKDTEKGFDNGFDKGFKEEKQAKLKDLEDLRYSTAPHRAASHAEYDTISHIRVPPDFAPPSPPPSPPSSPHPSHPSHPSLPPHPIYAALLKTRPIDV